MPDITIELPRLLAETSKETLYATGAVPRPQVHLLAEDMDQPYLGYVVSRPFYRGDDVAVAIGDMGTLASVLKTTRLVIMWEDLDLRTALEESGLTTTMSMMVLEVPFEGHTLHRHPFEPVKTGQVVDGVPTIRLEWGEPQRHENAPLPHPIARLLDMWREFPDGDIEETVTRFQKAGYELNWTRQSK